MSKENNVQKAIKEAKFIKALVDTGGNLTEAYQQTRPQVTRDSANVGGSKTLSAISNDDTKQLLVKIGCTKEAVLEGIWERMEKTKRVGEYVRGADVICKIGGYYTPANDRLRDLMETGFDLVEVVKLRLRKTSNTKDLSKVIDVSSTSINDLDKAVIKDPPATS